MSILNLKRIARAEPHRPHRRVVTDRGEAKVEPPQREVGPHDFVNRRLPNRLERWHDLAQLPRQIPTHSEPLQPATHRVERTPLVVAPQLQRNFLARRRLLGRKADVAGKRAPLLVHQDSGDAPLCPGELVPLGLRFAVDDLAVVARPRLDRREVRVVADERQPIVPRHDAISPVLQPTRVDLQSIRMLAPSDKKLHEFLTARLCDDRQLHPGDFGDISLQLPSREPRGPSRGLADDDLSPRLAIVGEDEIGGSCGGG